jgi:hypothetical protein
MGMDTRKTVMPSEFELEKLEAHLAGTLKLVASPRTFDCDQNINLEGE